MAGANTARMDAMSILCASKVSGIQIPLLLVYQSVWHTSGPLDTCRGKFAARDTKTGAHGHCGRPCASSAAESCAPFWMAPPMTPGLGLQCKLA